MFIYFSIVLIVDTRIYDFVKMYRAYILYFILKIKWFYGAKWIILDKRFAALEAMN